MTDTIATLGVTLKGDAKALDAALARAERDLKAFEKRFGTIAPKGRGADPLAPLTQSAPRATASLTQIAQAEARLLATTSNLTGAKQRLATALQGLQPGSLAAIRVQTQMAQVQNRLSGQTMSLSGTFRALGSSLGAIGLGVGLSQLTSLGIEAGRAALQMQTTQNVTKALAGDQATYNTVLAAATRQQQLYGGSLQENLQGLSGLIVTARSSGAELEELIELSQRLSILDPSQGTEGARIALAEALSGDPRSLAMRYEIPRSALEALKDEGLSASERLQVLDQYLSKIGVTSELVGGAVSAQAQVFNEFGIELDKIKNSAGQGLADAFEQPAQGLARLFGVINQNPQALAELKALFSGRGSIDQGDIDRAAKDLARRQADQQLGGDDPVLRALQGNSGADIFGAAQYDQILDRVAALAQAGGPAAEAIARLNEQFRQGEVDAGAYRERLAGIEQFNADPLIAIGAASAQLATDFQAGTAEALNLSARMTELAGTSDANRLAVIGLANGYSQYVATNGEAGISAAELERSIAALEQAHGAQASAAAESDGATLGLADSLIAAAGAIEGTTLASQAQKAALESAAHAAFEAENADKSLEDQARAAAQALFEAGGAGASAAAQLAQSSSGIDVMTAAFYRLLAAKQAALGGGGAIGGLGETVKGAGQATAAIRTLNKVYGAGPLAPKPTGGGRGAGGRGGGSSAASKAADAEIKAAEDRAAKLAQIEERAQEAALSAEARYQEERLSIIEKANAAILEAQRDLQAESAGSRADFYDSLTSSDLPQDVQQNLSAAYEQAFAEAQRLSQEGKAELAGDYLSLKEDQLVAEQRFQAARAKAAADGDKGEVARLEAIKRLRDAEFSARESNLIAGGDANIEGRDAALDQAAISRQEALADAQAAAAKAALDAEGKTLEAARLTNEQYLERLRIMQQLGPQGGGPALPAPVAAPAAPTATAAALPGASAAGGTVPVSAPDVVAALGAATAELKNALRAVENATRQRGQPSVMGSG